jgi:hypothetical protein
MLRSQLVQISQDIEVLLQNILMKNQMIHDFQLLVQLNLWNVFCKTDKVCGNISSETKNLLVLFFF